MALAWPLVALVGLVLAFLCVREWQAGARRAFFARLVDCELKSANAELAAARSERFARDAAGQVGELATRVSKLETGRALTRALP